MHIILCTLVEYIYVTNSIHRNFFIENCYKTLINKGAEISLGAAIALEREGFGVVASTEDLQEGVSAFIEKRKPTFKGR